VRCPGKHVVDALIGWHVSVTLDVDPRPSTWVLHCHMLHWRGREAPQDRISTLVNRRFVLLSLGVGPVVASVALLRKVEMPSHADVYRAAQESALARA